MAVSFLRCEVKRIWQHRRRSSYFFVTEVRESVRLYLCVRVMLFPIRLSYVIEFEE